MRNLPGFGDEATWPPCTNHPNDPRTPSAIDEATEREERRYEYRCQLLEEAEAGAGEFWPESDNAACKWGNEQELRLLWAIHEARRGNLTDAQRWQRLTAAVRGEMEEYAKARAELEIP